jgi:hypothetical protein
MAVSPYPPTIAACPSTPGVIPDDACPCPEKEGAEPSTSSSSCAGTVTVSGGDGGCSGSSYPTTSVVLSSGQFTWRTDLLSIDALGGAGWSFGLNYLGNSGVDSILGKGFDFPRELRLVELPNGNVDLLTGGMTRESFLRTGPNTYAPAEDNNALAELIRSGSGEKDEFTLIASSGTRTNFFGFDPAIASPGRLKSITDRYGSQQTHTWQRMGELDQVASITDTYGRSVQYRYYGSEFGYRLREIEDCLGRKLNFQYDAVGHLVAVVTPSILLAAEGNTFPGVTAYVFQYDVQNPRPERGDDLIRIWYPNQTTPFIDAVTRTVDVAKVYADAVPRYAVEYGQDPTDADLWGRVMRETIGSPEGGVGSTYQYLYSTANLPANLIDSEDPIVFRYLVTDHNGNQTIYDFNRRDLPVRVEVMRAQSKISIPSFVTSPSYVTWTKYNASNQPVLKVFPEGSSEEYEYETGTAASL